MRTAFIILVCFFSSGIYAEVYKWVDDKGVVHYGDKKKDGDKAVEIQVDTTVPETGTSASDSMSRDEKRRRIADAMEEDRLEKKETREKEKLEREQNKRKCNQLKDTKKSLKAAGGVYKLDKEGNRVTLSDSQRIKNEKKLNKQIKKYCR